MVGSLRSWAQAILLVGTIAGIAPFLHVGGPAGRSERSSAVLDRNMPVSSQAIGTAAIRTGSARGFLAERAKLRLLVPD